MNLRDDTKNQKIASAPAFAGTLTPKFEKNRSTINSRNTVLIQLKIIGNQQNSQPPKRIKAFYRLIKAF